MKNAIKYFGYMIFAMMLLGMTVGIFQDNSIHPLHAVFTLVFMYFLLKECWFALRFLFWFDELRQEFNAKAGERIVPRQRLTWELLTSWRGSTRRATRWRRRYNIMAIFAILMCCSVLIYAAMIYLVLGFLGGSSGGSGGKSGGDGETPWERRGCHNCRFGYVGGCQLADGGNSAGPGGSCSRWQP